MAKQLSFESFPPPQQVDPAIIAKQFPQDQILIVLDDDPTGTQSVADLPVLTSWAREDFEWAFQQQRPAIYVLTNSRSLSAADAAQINREIVRSALDAAVPHQLTLRFVSRSDSTLRGHFPLETDVIAEELTRAGEPEISGVILSPSFSDAGRITVHGTHGTLVDGEFTPAGETEFAQDSTFGYRSSHLADWVEEKTAGAIKASDVVAISLEEIRQGVDVVINKLLGAPTGSVIIHDVTTEDDLRILALALQEAETAGRRYIYRVGPPFVRARIGQNVSSPLEMSQIDPGSTLPATGGLIVVGSHVGLTSRQLAKLQERRPNAVVIELNVPQILDETTREETLHKAVANIVDAMETADVILHSSRELIRTDDPEESLAISRSVSAAIVEAVQRTLEAKTPRFVIAKGGITSSDVASKGLQIRKATVRGSLLPGIVSLWEPADGPAQGIPYVVFAGNVGNDDSLADVVEKLSAHS